MLRRRLLAGPLLLLGLAACAPDASSTVSTTPVTEVTTAGPTLPVEETTTTTTSPPVASSTTLLDTPATTVPIVPEDRWVEIVDGAFVDTRTGEPFVPLGVNLLLKRGGGGADRMFSSYDEGWVDAQLDEIAALGFSTVRFFLDMCMRCTATSDGIREDYLDALADLLTRLEAHGLVALPTSNDVPDPGFSDRLPCCEPFGGYRNSLYLSEEGHEISVAYWTALIDGIRARGTPTHHVLGWQLANEQFILRDVAPVSLTEGFVTTADGITYDLANDAEVEAMFVSNLREYITTVGDAIRELDPGALVTMGFFSAADPEAGRIGLDQRWVVPAQIVADSTLDFVDLHAYPGFGGTWDAIGTAFGLTGEEPTFPVLLGEFGAFEDAYQSSDNGAAAMARWQAGSCDFGFDGWLLWFWGAEADDEVIPVNLDDAAIARALTTTVRPDPCDVGPYASANFALERPVTASAEENAEYSAVRVVDGSASTWWSAADGPPQWVEIDLEGDRSVSRVEILIGHVSPPGLQTHRVRLRSAGDPAPGFVAGEVTADVPQGTVLTVEFDTVPDVRFVRVETLAADGWVILHEIEVFAG
ncbi:MAG: discoidin domain-containing protein [Acidimicrobiia bacterium]